MVNLQAVLPTAEQMQSWANDPVAAQANLRSIFLGLKADESMQAWATEVLENCGPPLESNRLFLEQSTSDPDGDVAYWACGLIERLGPLANPSQAALCAVLLSEEAKLATRQKAALALGSIGALTTASHAALQQAAKSSDPRLARLAAQSLGSTT